MIETLFVGGLTVAITHLAVGAAINFLGFPGLSAAGIASALAVIGSVVGTGMFGGVVTVAICGVVVGSIVGGVFVSKFCF